MNDPAPRSAAAGWRPPSLAINASAGYGKTEILALRIVALLLAGCAPASFTAMTFTRAAAAEIYSRILLMLSKALGSDDKFAGFKENLRKAARSDLFDAVSPDDLRDLLATLVREMSRLRISTFDSFFMSIVRCFPLELGLPADAKLISEDGSEMVKDTLFHRLSVDTEGDDDFVSVCREMMFGEERKSLRTICGEMVTALDRAYPRRNDAAVWGGDWLTLHVTPQAELDAALRCCKDYQSWPRFGAKLLAMLERCAQANRSETRFARQERDDLRAFLAVFDRFPQSKPEGFAGNRGWNYPDAQAEAIRILVRQGGRLLLHQTALRTEAVRKWYSRWCRLYADEMWRRGRLQFADLPKLLRDGDPFGCGDGDGEEWLCEIEYRMNSRFHHFLLDEFQDTSRAQWAVLEPMTASDDEHSLFLVGDIKQAIYGWRDGDSRLLGEVADGMAQDSLKFSYRYGAAICEAINHIFGEIIPKSGLIPAAVGKRWLEKYCFQPHRSAAKERSGEPRPGRFTVYAVLPAAKEKDDDNGKAGNEGAVEAPAAAAIASAAAAPAAPAPDHHETVARLILKRLRALHFPAAPLECGVLCRSEKDGVEIRNRLIRLAPELANRIIWDGKEPVARDPLVNALLAMLIAIRHPAETAAREMVRMYPRFAELLPQNAEGYAAAGALLDQGIVPMLLDLCRRIRKLREDAPGNGVSPIPSENPANLEILLAAAAEFDAATPRGSVRDFCRMMQKRNRCGIPQEGTLRMLTAHHSKGLTLDVVFYPLPIQKKNETNLRSPDYDGILAENNRPDSASWIIFNVNAGEGSFDPELRKAAELRQADRIFEDICLLYVALTRARYETVLIIPPASSAPKQEALRAGNPISETGSAWYLDDVLLEGLFADKYRDSLPEKVEGAQVFETHWGGEWPLPEGKTADLPALTPPPPEALRPVPRRVTPSRTAGAESTPHLFFTLPDGQEDGADFGTRVHECFAAIDRLGTAVLPADPKLAEELRRCQSAPAILDVVDEATDEVWKERPFDVLLDDPESPDGKVQLTGCFDRVHIRRDETGHAIRARIIDYKSNRVAAAGVETLVLHYTPQLRWYRRALARLLDLDPKKIRCTLIFTRPGVVAEVPSEA